MMQISGGSDTLDTTMGGRFNSKSIKSTYLKMKVSEYEMKNVVSI